MDVFDLRERLIGEYRRYSSSFVRIADPDLRAEFDRALDSESMWPHPMLALNPSFEPGGTIDDLAAATLWTSNSPPAGVKRALPCCSCELFMPLFASFRP